ncbi:MerR family transcriptional regulator [Kribbella sp. NPDC004138]
MGGLSIGQVAERTGLSVHALRFYEREGLLADPVRRESNGRRVYSEDDVDWLTMCIKFRSSGMPPTPSASTRSWSGRDRATRRTGWPC